MSYRTDRAWSDLFLPEIRRLVGAQLLVPASLEVDTRQAGDLVVLRARDMVVACRVRRPGYAAQYPTQFTLRCARDSGARTELQKFTDGFGDWLFYGHAAAGLPPALERWFVIDLAAWRAHMIRNKALVRPERRPNGDGTYFAAFELTRFPAYPSILIASSHEVSFAPVPAKQAAEALTMPLPFTGTG